MNATVTDYTVPKRRTLAQRLEEQPFQSYVYSYPHKTAYRPFDAPLPLEQVWREEDKSSLFLYLHVPFCEMRCGFCNLFTMAKPGEGLRDSYVDVLRRQARRVAEALGPAEYARIAVGGGTPTQLDAGGVEALFDVMEEVMKARPKEVPVSFEMSPETVTPEKLRILAERGVDRASIGIQSFIESETRALRRPQAREVALAALDMIREAGISTLNLDLIYGIRDQTPESWQESLRTAMSFAPEEVYLYPLYVRPLTGLGNSRKSWDDLRLRLYRQGRDFLLEAGYEQISMRMFRRRDAADIAGPIYRCQEDAMVGLGVGARSYTEHLHYSTEYAVGRRGVTAIVEDFVARDSSRFDSVDYGIRLDDDERKRRFVILSLLSNEGLDPSRYRQRFASEVFDDFPELVALEELELGVRQDGRLLLTARGFERSDTIGPWLYSERVIDRMEAYELR